MELICYEGVGLEHLCLFSVDCTLGIDDIGEGVILCASNSKLSETLP